MSISKLQFFTTTMFVMIFISLTTTSVIAQEQQPLLTVVDKDTSKKNGESTDNKEIVSSPSLRRGGGGMVGEKKFFQWALDPNATLPCTEAPGCYNHIKESFDLVPVYNITTEINYVFQTVPHNGNLCGLLSLNFVTQAGCYVNACHLVKKYFGLVTQEECFNWKVEMTSTHPDGKTVEFEFGGLYYKNAPGGEMYMKFERKNYRTDKLDCTYDVVSGFKRWL
jgi:hypothetical protein